MVQQNVTVPAQNYYPSCVVDLLIRYDSTLTANASGATAFGVGVQTPGIQQPSTAYTGTPLFSVGPGNDGNSFVAGRVPLKARVELAGYRQAGKFSLTFDYRDLPIDPRLVRSIGVRIYMDTVSAKDFADGIALNIPERERQSQMLSVKRASFITPTAENLVMAGVVDNWSVAHRTGGSEVTMDGRDQRAILLNSPLNPELLSNLDLSKPIDSVVQQIIGVHPLLAGYAVIPDDASLWPKNKVPSPVASDDETNLAVVADVPFVQPKGPWKKVRPNRTRVRMSADGKKPQASPKGVPAQINFWDLIVNYCSLCGAVPYVTSDGQNGESVIRIKPARDLYNQLGSNEQGNKPYPGAFKHGTSTRNIGTETLRIRKMVMGHNIEELSYERKFMGAQGRTIRVISLNTSGDKRGIDGKLLIAEYPTPELRNALVKSLYAPIAQNIDLAKVTNEAPSGATAAKDVLIFYKPGIKDQERLNQIAKDLYEEINRGEQGGSVKTRNLASFGGGNQDPDLIYLRPGDAMELKASTNAIGSAGYAASPLTDQARQLDDGTLYKTLLEKFRGDANHARAVMTSLKSYAFELQSFYRVSTVKFDWDISSGVAIAFDFHNYVVARDQTLALSVAKGVKKTPTPKPTVAPNVAQPAVRIQYTDGNYIPALPSNPRGR